MIKQAQKSKDCGKRAFQAGLRWCGIEDSEIEQFQLEKLTTSDALKDLARFFNLTWHSNGSHVLGNKPVLVVYRDNFESTDSEYHAVFASDVAPFSRWEITFVVSGWEDLKERQDKFKARWLEWRKEPREYASPAALTPSGVASTGQRGRRKAKGSPGTPPLRRRR